MTLSLHEDAFSDGQVRSKIWLADMVSQWAAKHFENFEKPYVITWYGSWVGVGPFLLLSKTNIPFSKLVLVEIDEVSLQTSKSILNHWDWRKDRVFYIKEDINRYVPGVSSAPSLFINTICEHLPSDQWLKNIPPGSLVILQATDMPHDEHTNRPKNLADFTERFSDSGLKILESAQLNFDYLNGKTFSRFMILGRT